MLRRTGFTWVLLILSAGALLSATYGQGSVRTYWFGHSLQCGGNPYLCRLTEFEAWKMERGLSRYDQRYQESYNYSYDIKQSWNDTYNKDSVLTGNWDFVCYNKLYNDHLATDGGGNPIPAQAADTFYKYHSFYIERIQQAGAAPVIYDDWHYDATAHVLKLCRDKGAYLAPINAAYLWVKARYPNYQYLQDWAHAAEPLALLAGYVCWATLTGQNPAGLSNVYPSVLDDDDAHLFQQVAWNAVVDSQFLPFQPWNKIPTRVRSILFVNPVENMAPFAGRQLLIRTDFDDGAVDSASHSAIFRSLSPAVVSVSHSGKAVALSNGTGWVEALREKSLDTLEIKVGATGPESGRRPGDSFMLNLDTWPNPSRAGLGIGFRLPGEQPVRLAIHELSGRLVKTLVSGTLESGKYRVQWDGRNEDGGPAAAGAYLIILQGDAQKSVRKIVVTH